MRCKCCVKSLPDRQHNNCINMYEFGWCIHALAPRASTAKSVHWNPSVHWSAIENTTRESAAGKIPKIHTSHSGERKHQQPFLKLTVLMWGKPKTWAMDSRINYFISCYMFQEHLRSQNWGKSSWSVPRQRLYKILDLEKLPLAAYSLPIKEIGLLCSMQADRQAETF